MKKTFFYPADTPCVSILAGLYFLQSMMMTMTITPAEQQQELQIGGKSLL
jgi:hypothetical protein